VGERTTTRFPTGLPCKLLYAVRPRSLTGAQRLALEKVAAKAAVREKAEREFYEAIKAAALTGATHETISQAAGYSHRTSISNMLSRGAGRADRRIPTRAKRGERPK
jgi:predicted transcriptional regulator